MQINVELIRSERLKRAWSQEQLAQVAGLGVRTVQRVESGGSASFETVKALAAVLELSVENLLVEVGVAAPVLFWRRPLNLVATASAALLVLLTSIMLVPTVVAARQVEMNIAIQRNDGTISQPRVTTQDGQAFSLEIDNLVRVVLTPRITDKDKGLIMIQAAIYTMHDGKYELSSKPSMLMEHDKASQLRIQSDDGQQINLSLTPQIK